MVEKILKMKYNKWIFAGQDMQIFYKVIEIKIV